MRTKKKHVARAKKQMICGKHVIGKKQFAAFTGHPVTACIIILGLYFVMDALLLNVTENAGAGISAACLLLTLVVFYGCYVYGYQKGVQTFNGKDVPCFIKNKKRYIIIMFRIITLLTILIPLGYDEIITKWMPNLDHVYYSSQVFLYVLIAPILEELSFRYFLYDRWAKPKFGMIKGIAISGFLFVICHPVGNINALILYWVPALLFYLVYDSFGLYGSILAHIIFNFIAL